jgi:hypothetical protein
MLFMIYKRSMVIDGNTIVSIFRQEEGTNPRSARIHVLNMAIKQRHRGELP